MDYNDDYLDSEFEWNDFGSGSVQAFDGGNGGMSYYQPVLSLIFDFVKQSITDSLTNFWNEFFKVLLVTSLTFRVLNIFASLLPREFANLAFHTLSIAWGISVLYFTDNTSHLPAYLLFICVSYGIVCLLKPYKNGTNYLIIYVVFCMLTFSCYYGQEWSRVCGTFMIISMKLVSVSYDVRNKRLDTFPLWYEFFGYSISGANVLLGPWFSYAHYKHYKLTRAVPYFSELCTIMWLVTKSILYLTLIGLDVILFADNNDFSLLYRQALRFRLSNYFICQIAQVNCLCAGYECEPVTKPAIIEWPRSIVQVVATWNIPIHLFLRKYIFTELKRHGAFLAVIGVYVVSSALHGFTGGITLVLLSLGVYSYVEYNVREQLSRVLDCCCRAKSCHACAHARNSHSLITRAINLVFHVFATLILAYTGFVFDDITADQGVRNEFEHCYQCWRRVYFFGHLLTALLLALAMALKQFSLDSLPKRRKS